MDNELKRPCTPAESLEQSLKEVQLIRAGMLPKKTAREMFAEIKKKAQKE